MTLVGAAQYAADMALRNTMSYSAHKVAVTDPAFPYAGEAMASMTVAAACSITARRTITYFTSAGTAGNGPT